MHLHMWSHRQTPPRGGMAEAEKFDEPLDRADFTASWPVQLAHFANFR
jgi:hypothetical protein